MGNLFGGGESKSNTVTNQTYTANPLIAATAGQALGQAATAASSPFNMPVAPVAGFSPLQMQAFNQYQALQGSAQPYYDTAKNLYNQSASPVTGSDINQYYNPMSDKIFAAMDAAQGAESKRAMGSAISRAGGVGADRLAVTQANLAQKHELDTGQMAGNLWQSALAAAQADRARQSGAAQGLTGLGTSVLGANLQGTGALYGAGQSQQQQSQAELNAPYNWQLAKLAYPFQTAQYLAGITGGLAPALGGTTNGASNTTSTPAQPSIFSQLGGLALGGFGLYNAFNGGGGGTGNFNSVPAPGGGYMPMAAARGGRAYAEGGGVDDGNDSEDAHIPGITGDANLAPIPYMPMQSGAGHSGPLTGGINFPQPQQQSGGGGGSGGGLGDVAKMAMNFLPLMLKDGGSVPHYGSGGFLGMGVNDPDNPDSYDPNQPIVKPNQSMSDFIRANPPWPFNGGSTPAPPTDPAKAPFPTTQQPGIQPSPGLPASIQPKAPQPAPPVIHRSLPKVGAAATPPQAENPYAMPQDQLPYPDALERDAGQKATRSPWMALVQAGATMASTPGGIGTSIGKGMLAGTKALDDQRKEYRSEEELNQKARALFQQAKQHLDKYNKMTPYERGSLALRNRELDQEEAGVSGKPGKFTGADYARVVKYVMDMNPGKSMDQLQPMIDSEIARRRRMLAAGTSGAGAANVGSGDTAANAMPDPGPGNRVRGKWYIGPSGQPQQWQGQ